MQLIGCTSSDLTHLGDSRLISGHAAQLLAVGHGHSWQPQHQGEESLVPAERLLSQLTTRQRGIQRQV